MYRLTAFLFLILFAAPPAGAGELTPEDRARAARFAQRIHKVYEEGRALGLEMDAAADYIHSFHDGDIDPVEFIDALNPFLDGMRAPIDDFRASYPRAPSSPSLGSPERERILDAFAKMVVGLGGKLDRQLNVLYRLRDAALAGDDGAYDLATADTIALAGEMILAENRALEGSMASVAPENPKQGLIKAIIGGNEAMAVAQRIVEAGFRGEEFDGRKYALDVETGLRDVGRAIVESEKAAWRLLKDLEGKFAETDADRYAARYTGERVKAYERAFALERAILETERGLLDYLRAVNAGNEDADSAVETMYEFQADLDEQIQQRLEEQNIRQALADEYARALESLGN